MGNRILLKYSELHILSKKITFIEAIYLIGWDSINHHNKHCVAFNFPASVY